MKLRCGIVLCVMLAMAVGRIKENQTDRIYQMYIMCFLNVDD